MENIDERSSEIRYEIEKALRVQKNIEQNYERKRKLNLLDTVEEAEFKQDIEKIKRTIASFNRELLALESQRARRKAIDGKY